MPAMLLKRFDVDDFNVEGQGLAGQRVVEIDGHLRVIESFDHTWQLGVRRIVEDLSLIHI